jgi:hypothetical protein
MNVVYRLSAEAIIKAIKVKQVACAAKQLEEDGRNKDKSIVRHEL